MVKGANRRHDRYLRDTGLPTARLSQSLCVRSWPNPAGQGRQQTRFPKCYNGASMIVGIALKRHEEGFDSPAHVTLRVILN